jgi:hypothetical protein
VTDVIKCDSSEMRERNAKRYMQEGLSRPFPLFAACSEGTVLEENEGGVITWSVKWEGEMPNEIEALEGQHMTTVSILESWWLFSVYQKSSSARCNKAKNTRETMVEKAERAFYACYLICSVSDESND